MGDIGVSYFTGTPEIDIPIHNLIVKDFNLDIRLSYDASGIRVENHPGWVGQNWNLLAGGCITRTINGQEDELDWTGTGVGSAYPKAGYLYRYSELTDNSLNNATGLKTIALSAASKKYDYQPDIFNFNFMGVSGKFFMDNDGNWKVLSDNNIKIIFENYLITPLFEYYPPTGNTIKYPKIIGGFKLVDDKGTTYVFGYDTNSIEYSMGFFNQSYQAHTWKANSWYLTKVIDCHGIEVFRFEYERGGFIAYFYRADVVKKYDLNGNGSLFKPAPSCANSTILAEDSNVDGNLISPVYLKSIFAMGATSATISFSSSNSTEIKYDKNNWLSIEYDLNMKYSQGLIPMPFYYLQTSNIYVDPNLANTYLENLHWRKLDYILVNGEENKKIVFNYNNLITERLNLNSIDVFDKTWPYGGTSTQKYSYSFEYDQFNLLPGYLSKKVDHWGFYKGTTYSINHSDYTAYYNQRQSNGTYLKIGVLKKVIYPTGDYNEFEFEPHSYSKYSNDNRSGTTLETGNAGGLRIKKIIQSNGQTVTERNFKYVTGYDLNPSTTTSSGILSYKPKYYWPDWRVVDQSFGVYSQSVFSINSIIPLSNNFGPHLGYSEVTEIDQDNSFIIYKYRNFDDGSMYEDNPPIYSFYSSYSPYVNFTPKSLLRGKLWCISKYDNTRTLVEKTEFTYRPIDSNPNSQYILTTNANSLQICPGSAVNILTGGSNKIYYFDYDIINKKVTSYFSNGQVVKENSITKV